MGVRASARRAGATVEGADRRRRRHRNPSDREPRPPRRLRRHRRRCRGSRDGRLGRAFVMPTLFRSAFVIARRDFTATVFSKTFLLFLLGPLFPVLMGVIFGIIGGASMSQAERPVVA